MSSESMNGSVEAEQLSALVDGELDGQATEQACRSWKGDAAVRRTWHAYHLIGDVLRSDDLAARPGHDERFLLALRRRLEVEPVILAPEPRRASGLTRTSGAGAPAAGRSAARWMLPSAIAAGVLLVAGAFTALRPGAPPAAAPALALVEATPSNGDESSLRAASLREMTEPVAVTVDGKLIRDARLDRYLAAHKQFSGSSALGLPSAFLRSATVEAGPR